MVKLLAPLYRVSHNYRIITLYSSIITKNEMLNFFLAKVLKVKLIIKNTLKIALKSVWTRKITLDSIHV